MPKKRIVFICIAAFIFAIILFTAIFLSILHPDTMTSNELPMGAAPPSSSYVILSYGDLSSLALIIAMVSAIFYFILKA